MLCAVTYHWGIPVFTAILAFFQTIKFLALIFKLGQKLLWFSEGVVSAWTNKYVVELWNKYKPILTWTPGSWGKIRLLRPRWTRDKYRSNNKQERHKTHFEERPCQYWNVNIQQCFSLKNGRCELVCNLLPSVFLPEKCFFFSGFTS